MKIEILNSFIRDVKKIKDTQIKNKIKEIFNEIENSNSLNEIKNLKKMSGYNDFYRIRLKDYRIGIYFSENVIYLVRILHRKEIYKFFP